MKMRELVVLYNRTYLTTIRNIPEFTATNDIVEAYAREYDFERNHLSVMWLDEGVDFDTLGIK